MIEENKRALLIQISISAYFFSRIHDNHSDRTFSSLIPDNIVSTIIMSEGCYIPSIEYCEQCL